MPNVSPESKQDSAPSEGPVTDEPVADAPLEALVGSGTPSVKVRVNTGVFGLRVGETTTLVNSDEVQNNIRTGNLSIVTD